MVEVCKGSLHGTDFPMGKSMAAIRYRTIAAMAACLGNWLIPLQKELLG